MLSYQGYSGNVRKFTEIIITCFTSLAITCLKSLNPGGDLALLGTPRKQAASYVKLFDKIFVKFAGGSYRAKALIIHESEGSSC